MERLNRWYQANCNGDWEHRYGVVIETLDNPGWSIKIDLDDTAKEFETFLQIRQHTESETDWLALKKTHSVIEGACAPKRLTDMIELVADWLES